MVINLLRRLMFCVADTSFQCKLFILSPLVEAWGWTAESVVLQIRSLTVVLYFHFYYDGGNKSGVPRQCTERKALTLLCIQHLVLWTQDLGVTAHTRGLTRSRCPTSVVAEASYSVAILMQGALSLTKSPHPLFSRPPTCYTLIALTSCPPRHEFVRYDVSCWWLSSYLVAYSVPSRFSSQFHITYTCRQLYIEFSSVWYVLSPVYFSSLYEIKGQLGTVSDIWWIFSSEKTNRMCPHAFLKDVRVLYICLSVHV